MALTPRHDALARDLRDRWWQALVEALAAVGPDSPTQCAGWTAADVATHVWIVKNDPLGWPGIAVPTFDRLTRARGERALRRSGGYQGLLEQLSRQDGSALAMDVTGDRSTGHRHALGEWYVHLRDVTRPNDLPEPEVDLYTRRSLWLWTRRVAQVRGLEAVLVDPQLGRIIAGRPGPGSPVAVGPAPELLCHAYGREADVELTEHRPTP